MDKPILVYKGEKAVIKEERQLAGTSSAALGAELAASTQTPEAARQELFLQDASESVRLTPFEVKQHFVNCGDLDNANKAERLNTDSPKIAVARISAELSFFGASFLEGFLGLYSDKTSQVVARYEQRLCIIREQEYSGKLNASIFKVSAGKLEKIQEFATLAEAKKKLPQQIEVEQSNKITEIERTLYHETE